MVEKPKREVDNFAISCHRRCNRYYYYRIILGLVKPTDKKTAAEFGTAIHYAMDSYYSGGMSQQAIDDGMVRFTEYFSKFETLEDDKRTIAKGLEILDKYFFRYREEPFEVVATEIGGAFELGDYVYRTRIDLIVEWKSPRGIYGFDHKTTSGLDYIVVKPNNQVTGYDYNLHELYENVLGFQLNAIGVYKTTHTKKTGEPKVEREIFRRFSTTRTPQELKTWKTEVLQTLHQIEENVEKGVFPRWDSCRAYYRPCQYLDLCNTSTSELEQKLIEALYVVEPWVPYKIEGGEDDEGS